MKSRLDQIELRLQTFIESTSFIFPWTNRQTLFSHLLVEAIERTLTRQPDGQLVPAQGYTIIANPQMVERWRADPDFLPGLVKILFEAAIDAGLAFSGPPVLKLISDPAMTLGKLRIEPAAAEPVVEETGVIAVENEEINDAVESRPVNAFLILNGNYVFPLGSGVLNFGRRLDNQIVIDDPRVSRAHAQLRAIRGRYVLFDLNSTGGTYVNGQRISQFTLRPGDVISLAGVTIIYGEESSDASAADGNTSVLPSQPQRS
jgi:pSer/pThr/pTyr-binding forkhead associated (FHA) protein